MEVKVPDCMISSNYGMPIPKNLKYHRLERHGTRSFIKAARRRRRARTPRTRPGLIFQEDWKCPSAALRLTYRARSNQICLELPKILELQLTKKTNKYVVLVCLYLYVVLEPFYLQINELYDIALNISYPRHAPRPRLTSAARR